MRPSAPYLLGMAKVKGKILREIDRVLTNTDLNALAQRISRFPEEEGKGNESIDKVV